MTSDSLRGRLVPPLTSKRSSRLGQSAWLILAVFVLVGMTMPFFPDYENYRSIYETGGGYLALRGRDLGFVLLIQIFAPFLEYAQFRGVILIATAAATLYTMRKLQAVSATRLGSTLAFALIPFILLKFGAQIREGVALSLWLWVLLTDANRPRLRFFIPIALLSISIHLAIFPLWALTAFALYLNRSRRVALVLGIVVYAAFVYVVADASRVEDELFELSSDNVRPGLFTMLYWAIFPAIFLVSILKGDTRIHHRLDIALPVRTLGFVLRAAMIGLLIGLSVQIGLAGSTLLQKGTVADSIRLASLLMMLYCIYLAMRGKRTRASLLALFLLADTVRIMLAA